MIMRMSDDQAKRALPRVPNKLLAIADDGLIDEPFRDACFGRHCSNPRNHRWKSEESRNTTGNAPSSEISKLAASRSEETSEGNSESQTTNLGVGSSNLSGRAKTSRLFRSP